MEFKCTAKSQLLSKLATNDQHGENSPYFDGWKAYDNDPFHPTKNPSGVIQMGLAENQAVAKFMEKTRGGRASFDPDRIVMAGGATGANELLMFCLADPGDGFLVPTPYYPGSSSVTFISSLFNITGFRVGIVYSYNDIVVNCGRKMSSFGLVSSQTQHFLASLLSDEEFVENFLFESAKRLANRHDRFTKGLEEVGIKCLESNAGLFCWMDLRGLLKEATFESEMELWRVIINDVKLNVSPGSSFHCDEPGWFRVCFANMDDETVGIALGRIRMFVGKGKEEMQGIKKQRKQWKRSNLRLSFSSMMYDEKMIVSSPRIMSPQSPLVRART
ncbi:hypothetical protein RD792_010690 [Penstemon davidsonii]|uniref:Aminotransferase class I/classII large domain-containing protein n=1 Tax=Penstemon davidsonii TaxID=160366 RepID=A0ABR0D3C1_9LAMI|nr:hypothetical protein RD792_010690 [Penstemon davidsonii]